MQVRAIVFDANVFGKDVEPDVRTIELWASACARNEAELWIPEVVAWELASRVVEEAATFRESVSAHNRRLRKWGMNPCPIPIAIEVDEVIEAIEQAGAVVVETPADAALAALKDQVLQEGAGSRKGGTKTGAADSAWIRAVLEQNGGSEGLLIVTGDSSAVEKTCDAVGIDRPQIAPHLGGIRHLLAETSEPTAEQHADFGAIVKNTFTNEDFAGPDLTALADLSRPGNWWSPETGLDPFEWEHQESFVTPNGASVVGPVTIDGWTGSLAGTVQLDALVEEQYARQDQFGDHAEYVAVHYPAHVCGELTIFPEAADESYFSDLVTLTLDQDQLYVDPI